MFSVTHNDKFTLQNKDYAIWNRQDNGPCFADDFPYDPDDYPFGLPFLLALKIRLGGLLRGGIIGRGRTTLVIFCLHFF